MFEPVRIASANLTHIWPTSYAGLLLRTASGTHLNRSGTGNSCNALSSLCPPMILRRSSSPPWPPPIIAKVPSLP